MSKLGLSFLLQELTVQIILEIFWLQETIIYWSCFKKRDLFTIWKGLFSLNPRIGNTVEFCKEVEVETKTHQGPWSLAYFTPVSNSGSSWIPFSASLCSCAPFSSFPPACSLFAHQFQNGHFKIAASALSLSLDWTTAHC